MTRSWFAGELETVALFWRILRRDGIAMGFTTHDADLWFDGVLHSASPGMIPSSIRKSAGFEPDSAEVHGAISHESLSSEDLAAGRFDGAGVRIGLVDWQTRDRTTLYSGTIGTIHEDDGGFHAELTSRKAELACDTVPRTSPTCRAAFAGPGCNLNPHLFEIQARLVQFDADTNAVTLSGLTDPALYVGGTLRWLDGPQAGLIATILTGDAPGVFVLDTPIDPKVANGTLVRLREGCDHTLATCAARFANAANFRGEPHLPGNDLLVRYPSAS